MQAYLCLSTASTAEKSAGRFLQDFVDVNLQRLVTMVYSLVGKLTIFQPRLDFSLSHDARAKFLSAAFSVMLFIRPFVLRKLDLFSD